MNQKVRIDNINWIEHKNAFGHRDVQPLCPVHNLRMRASYDARYSTSDAATVLKCEDCEDLHKLPRAYGPERRYVLDRIDAKIFAGMKVLNLDDEAIPLAEQKVSSKDGKVFVTAVLTESKVGRRLVVYAGEKGKKDKTQIFVEPEIKRLAFDQKDLHPSEVFAALEATFRDGTTSSVHRKT